MKKLLPSVTLAFASLAAFTGFASAGGTFGLFTGCHCCKSCGGTITLRQYNAFSPVACGSMMFQGCVVAPPPAQPPAYPSYGGEFGSVGGECADGSCAALPRASTPMAYQGGYYPNAAYTYAPNAAYSYNPAAAYAYAQMMQAQMMQAQMMQAQQAYAQTQMQQIPQMQQMQIAPVNGTQPISARVP
jgi:hypothetical protein